MILRRRPFRPLGDGYRLTLDAHEREAVRTVCAELRELVAGEDAAAARLFPPAYRDDPEASAEYDELVRESLVSERLRAADTVAATIDAERLDEAQAAAWCGVLNDARLLLGERLGVTDDFHEQRIHPRDPRRAQLALYGWLTWLQNELVEALASRL